MSSWTPPQPGHRRDSHSPEAQVHASLHSKAPFVRRALTSLNSAFHRHSRPVSIKTVHLEDNRYGAMPIVNILSSQHNGNQVPHHYNHHHHHHHHHINNYKPSRSGLTPTARQALTYSTYSAHSNETTESYYSNSSTLTPMTTDDDASSTASHRPRTRMISSPGSLPSPLGTYAYTSGNYSTGNIHHIQRRPLHERSGSSAMSFTSSSAPSPGVPPPMSAQTQLAAIDLNPKTTTIQLKVKHLSRAIVHSGYLSKYVPRTFFSRKQWKRRYFILDKQCLYCFKSSDPRHPLLESIELCAEANVYVTDAFPGKRYCIQISCPNERDWFVLADTASEMSAWLRELKAIVAEFRSAHHPADDVGSHFSEGSVASSNSGQDHHHYHPSLPSTSSPSADYGRSTSRSGSPLPRSIDPYHTPGQMTSLNPPPRTLTPKPSTPVPAPPVRSTTSEREVTQTTRRRNNSNVSSGAHSVNDYISIDSVIAQAQALELADSDNFNHFNHHNSSDDNNLFGERTLQQLKQQHQQRQQQLQQLQQQRQQQEEQRLGAQDDYTNGHHDFDESMSDYSRPSSPSSPKHATMPRSVRESRIAQNSSHRVSIMSDRSDSMSAILPRRSSQRMSAAGVPRPLSPIGSLGRQGTFSSRPSPRNSLVVSPPPRSIHRPPSVAIRHSTQIVLPHRIQTDFANHPIMSKPPTQSLPETPDSAESNSTFNGSLSRVTSIRHQRELALSRQSSICSLVAGGGAGRMQGGFNPRASMLSTSSSLHSGATSSLAGGSMSSPTTGRPMSPIASLAEAPTQPLPEPPKEAQQASVSRTPSLSTEPTPARRISTIPRHHQPDLILPPRSKGRARSQSNEGASQTASAAAVASVSAAATVVPQDETEKPARRAVSPPPRLSAVLMEGAQPLRPRDSNPSTCSNGSSSSISSNSSMTGSSEAAAATTTAVVSTTPTTPLPHKARVSWQMHSLPIRTMHNLPAPPTGQPPSPQGSHAGSANTSINSVNTAKSTNSAQIQQAHRRAFSASSSPFSGNSNGTETEAVAVFGGAVARKSSSSTSQHRRFLSGGGSSSSGNSSSIGEPPMSVILSHHRLSALINGAQIPLPPTTTLPPVPKSASPPPLTPSPPPLQGLQQQSLSSSPALSGSSANQHAETNNVQHPSSTDIAERIAMPLPLPPAPLGPPPAVTVAISAAAPVISKGSTIAPIAEEDEEEEGEEEAKQPSETSSVSNEKKTTTTSTKIENVGTPQIESLVIQEEVEEVEEEEDDDEGEIELIVVNGEDDDDSEMDEVDVEDLTITVSKPVDSGTALPAYYASKEEGVVDYIFPSENKSALVTAQPESEAQKEDQEDSDGEYDDDD
ncbi:hypothetical protein BGW42_001562 [Actinomortierella wolfii]|nr:hypothetical protein BGW42_001562 [Actinomortierella wolfii]